jgi:hypothetical protein
VGDDRSDFLGITPSHILYFWELMDDNHVLSSTIGVLAPKDGASEEHVAATEPCRRSRQKKDADNEEETAWRAKISANLELYAQVQARTEAREEKKKHSR